MVVSARVMPIGPSQWIPEGQGPPCLGQKTIQDKNFQAKGALPSASSHALPAPKPSPTHAGHAFRLNSKTENTTPTESPIEERITSDESARSHYLFNKGGR